MTDLRDAAPRETEFLGDRAEGQAQLLSGLIDRFLPETRKLRRSLLIGRDQVSRKLGAPYGIRLAMYAIERIMGLSHEPSLDPLDRTLRSTSLAYTP